MPPNKRRHGSRPNHLLDVSGGKLTEPTEEPAATQLLDREQTPLSITGRSRIVLDPEEYARLKDAADTVPSESLHSEEEPGVEDPADAAFHLPADQVSTSNGAADAEPLQPFLSSLDRDSTAGEPPVGSDDCDDSFEELARRRPQPTQRNPGLPGSAAIASTVRRRGRPMRCRTGRQTRSAWRKRRWAAIASVMIAVLVGAVIVLGEEGHAAPARTAASQQAAGRQPVGNATAMRAVLTQISDAARTEAHHARMIARARAAKARAARQAEARRRRLERRRAAERARHRASSRHTGTGAPRTTTGTETSSTPAYTPSPPDTSSSSGSSGSSKAFGYGGLLGSGHAG